ncbi:hypothetical protein 2 [Hubei tombus-like virus 12]|uniref:hypothetical protein 2 n=1 Tax=Hubei tombus-like virus 12 TaxID=1923258 RepID=UPI00090A5D73|nr:hypothetical protein 2 [Hubei tombus-like virus 12]APG76520.1 hypothetical protein 2 [Hubei tombus-like virus 12]
MEKADDRHGTPRPPASKGCESHRRLIRIVPPIYGLWHCFTHSNCVCNDLIACSNRVIGVVPAPTDTGIKRLREAMNQLWPYRAMTPLSLEQSLASFKGSKLKLYQRAYDSLLITPLNQRDGRVKAFVKAEKFDPTEKVNPDPRMIQARDPRYNLHLAQYLRPLEHECYSLRRHGAPAIAKCFNPVQRANAIMQKWNMFENPVCFSLDCSRWDKHVHRKVLDVEHEFYQRWYPGEVQLETLLGMQKVNICTTSNGVKYTVDGGRMSGDMNTALGNVTLMCGMIYGAMKTFDNCHFEWLDDGDDCLVFVEQHDLARVAADLPRLFLEYGQELKIENIAMNPQDIVFCQSKLTYNGQFWTMARNWRKVLSQSCCGTKHWNDPNMVPGMFGLIGDCEMALHRGIPILQAFAQRLRDLSGGRRARMEHMDSSFQYRVGSYQLGDIQSITPAEVTEEARFEFQRTWGVDIQTQIGIEWHLAQWTPGIVHRDVGPELFSTDWCQQLEPGIPNPTVL